MKLTNAMTSTTKLFSLKSGAVIRGRLLSVELGEQGVALVIHGAKLGAQPGRWRLLASRVTGIRDDSEFVDRTDFSAIDTETDEELS